MSWVLVGWPRRDERAGRHRSLAHLSAQCLSGRKHYFPGFYHMDQMEVRERDTKKVLCTRVHSFCGRTSWATTECIYYGPVRPMALRKSYP